ncbi:ABC transporter permease [Candidatus Bipolaricaulota bacterium]|jgi:peptide/nickel transport system permease protein|nr:ABC transporter permease [Candidatus Bipolaricaulota bacterium]
MKRSKKFDTFRRLLSTPKGVVGVLLISILVVSSLVAPYITAHNPSKQNLRYRNSPPLTELADGSGLFILGTDQLGRDMLTRILYGTRISVLIALAAVFISGVIGVTLGVVSGFVGGWVETLIMRFVDIQLSLPLFLVAMIWISFSSPALINIIAVIAIWTWTQYARVARASTLSLRETGFVEASRSMGASQLWILAKHILPNILAPVLVIASLQFGRAIILEATLSFLGVGLQPPTPALGVMIASGRQYVDTAWWLATLPGVVIMLLVLGANFVGDVLRDVWDPKLR